MSEHEAEVSQIIRGRAAFYEFLSYVLQKPADENTLEIIKEFAPYFEAVAAETDIADLKTGACHLTAFAANPEGIDKLNVSYTTLFYKGSGSIPTSESVWLSPEKLMKQNPWNEVMELYAGQGLGIPVDFKEPEDHVCIELLFMSYLAQKCADELDCEEDENADELMRIQQEFLERHLIKWVPEFCGSVISLCAQKDLPLYGAVAYLLRGFLEYDKTFMEIIRAE